MVSPLQVSCPMRSPTGDTAHDPNPALLQAGAIRGFLLVPLILLLIALFLAACTRSTESPRDSASNHPEELRGVWITNVDSPVLESRESIAEAMEFLADHHFNAVFPVVWNGGYTLYPSDVAERTYGARIHPDFEGRDPLETVVVEARRQGLAVIPWFEFGFAAGYQERGPILDARPSWAARDSTGAVLTKNGFRWMNGYHPDVRDFIADLVREVATTYRVDGVQGDDRLPAQPVEGGYAPLTDSLYRSARGTEPPAPRDSAWMQWRADRLTAFADRIYRETKAIDATLQVSWSPSVYPWSMREYLQDWPSWLRRGAADLVHPQVYRRSLDRYRSTLRRQHPDSLGLPDSHHSKMYPGILIQVGDYRVAPDTLVSMVQANRNLGFNGEVLFFYEGLRAENNRLADTLKATVYQRPARLPFPVRNGPPRD